MNQDNSTKIICPRCGKEMSSDSRYCLNCGYLNPNDPTNKGMRKFMNRIRKNSYQVGDGQTIMRTGNQMVNSIGNNTGNKTVCFLINYLLYMFIIVGSFISIIGNKVTDLDTIKNSLFPYISFVVSIVFLYVYSMELVFMKANKKWWYALIPFYNLFVLCDIVFKKKMLGIILLIPVIGQLFFIVILYKLANKFKYNGVLTVLLPFIYIPLMGFGSKLYENVNYGSQEETLENDYKRKRVFFVSLIIFILFGAVFIFWNNIVEAKSKAFRIKNYYYVFATKQIVNKTKYLAKHNYLSCEKYSYSDNNGIYYIEYPDVGNVTYIPFHAYKDIIGAYIVIDNTSGENKYYVSMSDGTYGYPETLYDNINIDSVVFYTDVVRRKDINYCTSIK